MICSPNGNLVFSLFNINFIAAFALRRIYAKINEIKILIKIELFLFLIYDETSGGNHGNMLSMISTLSAFIAWIGMAGMGCRGGVVESNGSVVSEEVLKRGWSSKLGNRYLKRSAATAF